jgi:hypothetical protein
MLLGFHSKQLTERGTEVAMFDYALGAKALLGHDVRVFIPRARTVIPEVKRRFEEHFDVVLYDSPDEISCDALVVMKRGRPGKVTKTIPELNHAFADVNEPHGHRFAALSDWLARTAQHELRLPRGRVLRVPKLRKPDVIPYIVTLPEVEEDMRAELGIPDDAVVFGRHGGVGTFGVEFVRNAIRAVVAERRDAWFVLVNVERFVDNDRVLHVPLLVDRADIRRFVNTCDYMLHAHATGETFGLAPAEFGYVGVPVLTYLDSPRLAHVDFLRDGLLLGYRSHDELVRYLTTLERRTAPVPNDIRELFSPERVMATFDEVFLH